MKTLDLDASIKTIISALTEEEKLRWEELNGIELSQSLEDKDRLSLLASLLEALL